jgi:hypothetical protein
LAPATGSQGEAWPTQRPERQAGSFFPTQVPCNSAHEPGVWTQQPGRQSPAPVWPASATQDVGVGPVQAVAKSQDAAGMHPPTFGSAEATQVMPAPHEPGSAGEQVSPQTPDMSSPSNSTQTPISQSASLWHPLAQTPLPSLKAPRKGLPESEGTQA